MPSRETFISGIDGEGGSIGDGMFTGSSWVNTDWYCLFSISALPLGSEKRILLFLRGAVPTRSFFVAFMYPQKFFWMLAVGSPSSPTILCSMWLQ